jgi:hypothetical protein
MSDPIKAFSETFHRLLLGVLSTSTLSSLNKPSWKMGNSGAVLMLVTMLTASTGTRVPLESEVTLRSFEVGLIGFSTEIYDRNSDC